MVLTEREQRQRDIDARRQCADGAAGLVRADSEIRRWEDGKTNGYKNGGRAGGWQRSITTTLQRKQRC